MPNPFDQFDQPAGANPFDQFDELPAPPERVASAGDRALGSVPGRAALGASQVITGPLQLGANIGSALNRYVVAPVAEALGAEDVARYARNPKYDVGRAANVTMQAIEEAKLRGMKAHGKEGVDWAGLGGSLATGGAALKAVKPAASILGKIGQGSAIGAGFGAATPVTSGDEKFWETKALQTGAGTVLGAVVPATAEGLKIVGGIFRDVKDLLTKKGAEKIATHLEMKDIGEKYVPTVVQALRNIKPTIPGAKPTAAEALVGVPEGTSIAAHEARVAKIPGGPSTQFFQRKLDQEAARTTAENALDVATKPLRSKALAAANKGGVQSGPVIALIDKYANLPTFKPNNVVQNSMADFRQRLVDSTDANGVINANALYTIRKDLGTTIEKFSRDSASWDKKTTAFLVRTIQKRMDREIVKAGGKQWPAYLGQYSAGKRAIEADLTRSEEALKPLQRTLVSGGDHHSVIPNLLSRPAMVANAVLRLLKINVEPRVDAILVERHLNPQLMADALEKATPSQRAQIMLQMWQQYGRAVTIGAPVTAAAEAEGR